MEAFDITDYTKQAPHPISAADVKKKLFKFHVFWM